MEIWLVRHGETAFNAARILQPADTPLSTHGLQQAQALAERLAGERFAGILSSDFGGADNNLDWFYAVSPRLSRYSMGLREPRAARRDSNC